jgi:putative Mg2+ transporter-C (MgtC) family protein
MLTFHEIFIRLLFAGALGAAIGVEREIRRRPAGIRTSMFVCMATALFTVLSAELAHRWGDSSGTRIASNIVQGIGFLGAGAILRDTAGVIGMTTAATIFVEAAIGMAVGGGLYAVVGAATVIVLFALVVLSWVADWFGLRARRGFPYDHLSRR